MIVAAGAGAGAGTVNVHDIASADNDRARRSLPPKAGATLLFRGINGPVRYSGYQSLRCPPYVCGVCVCVCVRARARVCVRVCVRARVCVCVVR